MLFDKKYIFQICKSLILLKLLSSVTIKLFIILRNFKLINNKIYKSWYSCGIRATVGLLNLTTTFESKSELIAGSFIGDHNLLIEDFIY